MAGTRADSANNTMIGVNGSERPATVPTSAEDDSAELLLGRYRLGRRLGAGAFGTVFQARDERLDRAVAVKVIPRELVATARFEREARAAARLSHPAIVTLYEAAIDDEGAYLVSELVRGKTLAALLAAGECSDREILSVGIALCDALEHAHSEGVIHRDVKPGNVLVPRRGPDAAAAKLTDFGVAQLGGAETLTRVGDVVGTAAYMSPEQAAGAEVSEQSDLYSLALVLYEALSGVNPLGQALADGRARARVFIAPLRRQRRDLSRALAAAIDQALAAAPAQRGTIGELRRALAQGLAGASELRGVVEPAPRTRLLAPIRHDELAETRHDRARPAPRVDEPARPGRRRFGRVRGPLATDPIGLPVWTGRAANSLAAGLAAGWLSVHLLAHAPLAPAAAGLIAAAVTLLAPRLGWAVVLAALSSFAISDGRAAGALVLLALTLPPWLALLFTAQGSALPALAPALGVLGLAGAWPALVSYSGRSWFQRAVVAAAGYVWLVLAGVLWRRDLYWQPSTAATGTGWTTSLHNAFHQLMVPVASASGLAGALVWAAVAVLLPLTRSRRWPALTLIAAVLAAAATVLALHALGAQHLHGLVLGLAAAIVISGGPALTMLLRGRAPAGLVASTG